LKKCFYRAVRQAHVLYGGPPATGDFNLDYEVYRSRLILSSKVATLIAQETEPTGTEMGEAEAQGREAEAEEGECVEVRPWPGCGPFLLLISSEAGVWSPYFAF